MADTGGDGRSLLDATASVEQQPSSRPPPIEVLICEAAQSVIMRISDQGGGIDRTILPYLWSFSKGPRKDVRLQNLERVPKLAGTMQELRSAGAPISDPTAGGSEKFGSSLSALSSVECGLSLVPTLRGQAQ